MRSLILAALLLCCSPAWGGATHITTPGTLWRLREDGTPISAYPFSVAAWFRLRDATPTTGSIWFCLANSGSNGAYLIGGVVTDGRVYLQMGSGVSKISYTTGTVTLDKWHFVGGVAASTTSRRPYLDSEEGALESTSLAWPTLNRFDIGELPRPSLIQAMEGDAAYVTIWDVALTHDDMKAMANGLHPLSVRPSDVVAHWSLLQVNEGTNTDAYDATGNYSFLTASLNIGQTDSPPLHPRHPYYGSRLDSGPRLLHFAHGPIRCREEDLHALAA